MRFRFEEFTLDTQERRLLDPLGQEVSCAPKTLDALQLLVENAGQLVRRDDFHERLWPRAVVADETLGKLIWQVRKALAPKGEGLIETVPRHGYRLRAEVQLEEIAGLSADALQASAGFAPDAADVLAEAARSHRHQFLGWRGLAVLLLAPVLLIGAWRWWSDPASVPAVRTYLPMPAPRALAAAQADATLAPWVAEGLSAALALELGLNEQAPVHLGDALTTPGPEILTQRVSSAGAGRWLWQIARTGSEQQVSSFIEADGDLRSQLQSVADSVRNWLALPLPGLAQQAGRSALLPSRWDSLSAYAQAERLLMQRKGRQAAELLEPVLKAEPGFVPASVLLARAYYLQARDPESARIARAGLARSAQLPPELRLALEAQLDEAEGRYDQAFERALSLHQLQPDRYAAALAAARLAGHTGHMQRFDQLIAAARELGQGYPEVDLLDSVISLRRDHHERALDAAEAAAKAALALGWQELAAEARLNAARALAQLRRFSEALDQIQSAREIAADSDPSLQAQMDLVEGTLLGDLGRLPQAQARLDRAEAWFRNSGAMFELASVLDTQGGLATLQGQLPRARKLADESLQLAEVSGDRHLAVAISIRMALAYLDAGEMAVAKRWLSTAVTRAGDVGNSSLLAWALADWARAAWAAGFPDEAKTAASRSLPLALDQQDWARASQLSGLLGDLALTAAEGEDAARRYRQARDYAERSDEPQVLAMVNREAAARALRCGQTAQAQLLLDQARAGLQTATPDGQQSLLARERVLLELQAAELAIAQARFDQGDGFLRAAERGLDARSERNLRVKLSLIDARRLYLSGDSAAAQLRLQELGDLRAAGLERSALARDSLLRAIADDDRQEVAAIAAIEPSLCAEAADVNPRAQAAPDPARGNRQPDQDADERSEPNRINRD